MGNCAHKGVVVTKCPNKVRVLVNTGRVLEFEGPKLVQEVVKDFPGCGIFRENCASLRPLHDDEVLAGGQCYYLLPVAHAEPIRMSTSAALDLVTRKISNGTSALEVLPPPQKGVWRVKLVIDPKLLEEILSEQVDVDALIAQIRMAACSAAPRRRVKGFWGVSLNPILGNVFKEPADQGAEI
ncbi:hypothetical protein RJ640_019080 [Escallonia rubra]|uniref:Uncharacterized protein n=1 Tax=Escallonia rubra TaxID=112253 RepID=A0AA88RT42_9ASTE|nr:hypothetical protein RJ640_019080 [Escallonia rubra]